MFGRLPVTHVPLEITLARLTTSSTEVPYTKTSLSSALTYIEEYRKTVKHPPIIGVVSVGDGIWPSRPFTANDDFHLCAAVS